jgi:hypothetical protein
VHIYLSIKCLFLGAYTILRDKVYQCVDAGWWFSQDTPVSSTNKTDRHDIPEILLKLVGIVGGFESVVPSQYNKTDMNL